MPRRKPYTRVVKRNQLRADHVRGMGDVVFKGFQCLNSECREFIFVRKDEIGMDFEITCPSCGLVLRSDGESKFYEYTYNPEAIARLKTPEYVDELLTKYSAYMPEIIKWRNRLLADEGFDFFEHSTIISPDWVQRADEEYERTRRHADDSIRD